MDNNRQQFNMAYGEYSGALFRYCFFKVNDRETAKDLLQETFCKAWAYVAAGNTVDNLRAFLYKILGNLIIDKYRKHGPDASLEILQEAGFDPGFDDTERLIDSGDSEHAAELIEKIPEPYGQVLSMRYVNDMSIREIAHVLNKSENAVTVRLHRGLKKLRDIFNHRI